MRREPNPLIAGLAACALLAAAKPCVAAACPLEVVGTWRLVDATDARATLLSFTPNGWANVLNGPGEENPGDIAAQVGYRLAPPRDPRRIDFDARRGNDVFVAGTTSWEITSHSDDSFTSRARTSLEGVQNLWARVQTHRYFLTFAARAVPATGETAAFVMWTTLDGRRMELDALGAVQRDGAARFGQVPFELARAFAKQGDPARDVMLRIELSEAEFRRTRAVRQAWVAGARSRDDPGLQATQLIEATIESVNRCAPRIQATAREQRPVELVRLIRRANDRRHIPDKAFPAAWKPPDLT